MSATSIMLTTFEVYCVINNSLICDQLYANGRQQLHIGIKVTKTVNGVNTPLSTNEKNSLTLIGYGQSGLPANWTTSTTNSGYTQGLRTSLAEGAKTVELLGISGEFIEQQANPYPEVFYRYLSSSDGNVQPQQFVARITLDNGTTFNTGETRYNKVLTISPRRPYVINSNELIRQADQRVFYDPLGKNAELSIDLMVWVLPGGLTIRSYTFPDNGPWPHYYDKQYAIRESAGGKNPMRTVMALTYGVTSFLANELMKDNNKVQKTQFTIPNHESYLRATRGEQYGIYHTFDSIASTPRVVIIDNYGCQCGFNFIGNNDVNNVDIRNA